MTNLKTFFKDESGATAIEYGLLAALISIVGITVFTSAGTNLKDIFQKVSDKLATAAT